MTILTAMNEAGVLELVEQSEQKPEKPNVCCRPLLGVTITIEGVDVAETSPVAVCMEVEHPADWAILLSCNCSKLICDTAKAKMDLTDVLEGTDNICRTHGPVTHVATERIR